MARFRFSLQKVLDIKQIRRKQEVVELASLRKKENELLHEVSELEIKLQETFEHLYELEKRGRFSIVELRDYSNYVAFLRYDIESRIRKLNELKEKIREKTERVKKLYQDEMVLERLKSRRYMDFLREENRKEQKVVDEIATLFYSRR